ncbi:MAG: YdeI/OmpD-associated family protein [Flavobacteriaceae bacterium]
MNASEKVSLYIEKLAPWKKEFETLREIFQKTELTEEIKWGTPTYTLNGKLIAGFVGFKNHYALWFHQGIFLKDIHKKLRNAQEGKTKAMRQWRFGRHEEIPIEIVHEYLQEAIENCLAGKEVKVTRKEGVSIPPFLNEALKKDPAFYDAFKKLTPGRQREYAEYIETAKQEKTKVSRLEKIMPMILQGLGLHDKYKNC